MSRNPAQTLVLALGLVALAAACGKGAAEQALSAANSALDQAKPEIEKYVPGELKALSSEMSKAKAAFDKVKAEHGPIDVLVNNAGITRDGTFRRMTSEQWHIVIETNLNSLVHVTKQLIDGMMDRGWGRIINISSVNGQKGQFGPTNYSTAKAGRRGKSPKPPQSRPAPTQSPHIGCRRPQNLQRLRKRNPPP